MTTYDVFLSHASADKPVVEALARRLSSDGLEPFLDEWHLVPGEPWQEALEDALEASRTCAVFIGAKIGPWQNEEMRAALDEDVRNVDFRVVPVLLPGVSRPGGKDLPRFLRRRTWVDFRAGLDDDHVYHRLVSGIRGVAPGAGTGTSAAPYRANLPPRDLFVYRRELDQVRDLLVRAAGSTVGITTALRGAGGFGKTALARALCDEPNVCQAYPDGILWTTMGESLRDADRIDRVPDLVHWWSEEEPCGAGRWIRRCGVSEGVFATPPRSSRSGRAAGRGRRAPSRGRRRPSRGRRDKARVARLREAWRVAGLAGPTMVARPADRGAILTQRRRGDSWICPKEAMNRKRLLRKIVSLSLASRPLVSTWIARRGVITSMFTQMSPSSSISRKSMAKPNLTRSGILFD